MTYLYIKAIHIIFVVSWFAGLFYMPRLFIYHTESQSQNPEVSKLFSNQFKLMERKLWTIITTPAMVLTLISGISLIVINPAWLSQGWMQIKLSLVLVLLIYHYFTFKIYRQLQNDQFTWNSNSLRFWNEGATLLLVAIVFLVVLKNSFSWIWGLVGIILLGLILTLAIRLYRLSRAKKD